MVLGSDGPMKLMKKLVRIPDVSFTNWDRVPNRRVPNEPVPNLAPDLAVEVLSEGTTREEMERKLKGTSFRKCNSCGTSTRERAPCGSIRLPTP
jgi:Uma2 family endonuclease